MSPHNNITLGYVLFLKISSNPLVIINGENIWNSRFHRDYHFFLVVFFFSFSFRFKQFSKCVSISISANIFSQYSQATVFKAACSSPSPSTSPSYFSSFSSFLTALIAFLKSSEAAFQLSPVFQNPLPLVFPRSFFSFNLFCFTMLA